MKLLTKKMKAHKLYRASIMLRGKNFKIVLIKDGGEVFQAVEFESLEEKDTGKKFYIGVGFIN